MSQQDDRRKGLRANLPSGFFFNIRNSKEDYLLNRGTVLNRLGAIDSIPCATPTTDAQVILSRIDQKLTMLIGILAEKSRSINYTHYGLVTDISEFGLSFGHHLIFPQGAFLEMGLKPLDGDSHLLDICGKIIYVKPPPEDSSEFVALYGVEFVNMQSKDQNDIVQWIFAHQREQIRRRREQDS